MKTLTLEELIEWLELLQKGQEPTLETNVTDINVVEVNGQGYRVLKLTTKNKTSWI